MLNQGLNSLNVKNDSGTSALYSKNTGKKDSQQHKKSNIKSKLSVVVIIVARRVTNASIVVR